MFLDILFISMMAIAVFKGLRNGLIIAIFAIIGWILGLYLAFKFSDVVMEYLKDIVTVSPKTLWIISFIGIFILVSIIVHLGGKLIEKTVELALLGWINRLGGIFFYVLLYTLIFSVIIYFAERVNLLNEETIASSRVYPWVKPLVLIIQQPFLH